MEQNLSEISLDGFQVVSGELFKHLPRKSDATCTIWPSSIAFSKQSIVLLNNCEFISIQVNSKTKGILVVPVSSKDRDSLRWIKSVKSVTARKIECIRFTEQLYKTWGWDTNQIYRAVGRLVINENKVFLFFDFSNAETWKKPKAGEKNA